MIGREGIAGRGGERQLAQSIYENQNSWYTISRWPGLTGLCGTPGGKKRVKEKKKLDTKVCVTV
jgi:hypothetical protein